MLKRVTTLALLAALSLTAIGWSGCTQQKKSVRLRFKYTPGMTITHKMEQKRNWKVIENDSVIEQGLTVIDITSREEVRRVIEDSTAELRHENSWVYEHRNEEDSTKIDTVTGGRSYTSYVKPNGRLVDLEFHEDVDPEEAEYLRSLYEQAATRLPDGMVEQGKTWTHEITVMLENEKVNATTKYELTSFFRKDRYDCAVIKYEGNMIVPVKSIETDTLSRSGVDRIDFEGEMYFAYAEGVVISATERWLVDSKRKATKDGEMKDHQYLTESDVTYRLASLERAGE